MQMNRDTNRKRSRLLRALNFLGCAIERISWKYGKLSRYEERDGEIMANNGLFSKYTLQVSEIKKWSVYHEMGFDIVRIELNDNQGVTWIDTDNDLLAILRAKLPSKEES